MTMMTELELDAIPQNWRLCEKCNEFVPRLSTRYPPRCPRCYSAEKSETRREAHRSWADNQLKRQDGKCAICRVDFSLPTERMMVDHDHKSGRVRGLLCGRCNSGLGFFRDNPQFLTAAAEYLKPPPRPAKK